jgi:hypothetical protein
VNDCRGDHLWRGGGVCVLCGARLRCYCGAFVREDNIDKHLKACRQNLTECDDLRPWAEIKTEEGE